MEKKFIVITGANGGIGSSILSLLNNDYNIIALDLNNQNISQYNCHFIKCDLTNKEELNNAYQKIKEITNNIYAIINTVGIFQMRSLIEGDEEHLRKSIEINFFSIYSLNKTLFPLLKDNSRIINLTSEVARYSPQPFQAYYNLSKILLDNYTDILRREANYLSIKVIKIQSGSMKTSMLKSADEEYEEMVNNSTHFKGPLTKLKYMMDRELKKQNDPIIIAKLIKKILNKKNPKIRYRIKNSFALFIVGHLPERLQDYIYKKVIK